MIYSPSASACYDADKDAFVYKLPCTDAGHLEEATAVPVWLAGATGRFEPSVGFGPLALSSCMTNSKSGGAPLGRFDAEKDWFVFALPSTDVERDALRSFANTSVDYLRGMLKKRQQCQ